MKTSILKLMLLTFSTSVIFIACKKENINRGVAQQTSECFGDYLSVNDINSNNTNGFLSFDYYIDSNGNTLDSIYNYDSLRMEYNPISNLSYIGNKTPNGYYSPAGHMPVQLKLDYTKLPNLLFTPRKISFTLSGYSRSIPTPIDASVHYNIQLAGTPLIVTKIDDLPTALAPYGYTAQIYHYSSITHMSLNPTDTFNGGGVDSVVISGNNLSQITIGTDFIETEIRNICVYER